MQENNDSSGAMNSEDIRALFKDIFEKRIHETNFVITIDGEGFIEAYQKALEERVEKELSLSDRLEKGEIKVIEKDGKYHVIGKAK